MSATNENAFNVDLSYLKEISGGSAEFIVEMIDVFIEQTPQYFENLKTAIDARDWKRTGDAAHKIKPTLAFIGAEDAKSAMAEIERIARSAEEGVEQIDLIFAPMYASLDKLINELKTARAELIES